MFERLRNRRIRRRQAHAIYRELATLSRAPQIFLVWGVPDTLDGRFDSLVLHAFLVFRRLRTEGEKGEELAQVLFDVMFGDLDEGIRELGVGDMGVGRRIKDMARAFYGRVASYEEALAARDEESLKVALRRNLYRSEEVCERILGDISAWVLDANDRLSAASFADIAGGSLTFAPPPSLLEAESD